VPPGIAEPGFDELRGWEYDVLVYAHALGKAEDAAGLLQDAHDRARTIREERSSAVTGQRAVIVQWTAEGPVLLGPDTFSSVQLYRAGFSPVENAPVGPTSVAGVADLDADWLFIAPVGKEGQAAYREASVGLDPGDMKVVVVDGAVWASSAGPIAAELILDDIERALD
jgi:iron complex transport system substrate-binding protein